MIDQIDWADTPDSDIVPTDLYALTVKEVAFETTQNGNAVAHAQLTVDAPEEWKGSTVHARFFVGTEDDPGADQFDTWKKFGAQQMKKFCVGVFGGVAALTGNPAIDFESTKGYPVLALISCKPDNRRTIKQDGVEVDNPYYGRDQQRFEKWFYVNDAAAPAPGSMKDGMKPAGRPATPRPAPLHQPPVRTLPQRPAPAAAAPAPTAPAPTPAAAAAAAPARPGPRPVPRPRPGA